jgi:excisionase family DNA binding protein
MTIYTTEEAARAMDVAPMTIRRWVDAGILQASYVGIRRIIRIPEEELKRLAEEKQIVFRPKK